MLVHRPWSLAKRRLALPQLLLPQAFQMPQASQLPKASQLPQASRLPGPMVKGVIPWNSASAPAQS